MRMIIYAAFITALPTILHGQVLRGDDQFPLLNQIRWDMNKEQILNVFAANKVSAAGTDTAVTVDMKVLGFEAKTFLRFKNKTEKPWGIEVKFKELSEKLVDTLVNHFTRTTGASPLRAAKEKSLLLITMRMELAAWKTKAEQIRLVIGRRGDSIFAINLSLEPVSR